ncbi:MAG TPA: DUF2057 family protein [Pseudomonadales bacterium]|nr:DUF2057 family protein [Pseudomonadales bacterium]
MKKLLSVAIVATAATCVFPFLSGCQSNQDYYTTDKPDQNKAELAALKLPDEFDITRVNGKEYETPLVRTENQHFFFPAGGNQIEFRYKKYWQTGADNHEIVRSLPFVLEVALEAGHTYRIDYTVPADLDASREFAKKPEIRILDEGGKALALKTVALPSERAADAKQKPDEMLRYWWKQADADQRRAFEQWLKANP